MTSPNTDFAQAVLTKGMQTPTTIPGIKTTIARMIVNLQDGKQVKLGGIYPTQRVKEIAYLRGIFANLGHNPGPVPAGTEPAPKIVPKSDLNARPSSTSAPAAVNPYNFPVAGAARSDDYAWLVHSNDAFTFILQGCSSSCKNTDVVTSSLVVNPGPGSTRPDWNALYFPDAHNLSHIHFEGFSLCHGTTVCNNEQVDDDANNTCDFGVGSCGWSGSWSLQYDGADLHGLTVAHAFRFWIYNNLSGDYFASDAKTGNAVCERRPGDRCLY